MKVEDILKRLKGVEAGSEESLLAGLDIALSGRDAALRRALEAASIPHWFDLEILEAMLDPQDVPRAGKLLDDLIGFSFVEPFEAREAYNVHNATGVVLRKNLQENDGERFREMSARAAQHFLGRQKSGDGDPVAASGDEIEGVYHLLVSDPVAGAGKLRDLWTEWFTNGPLELCSALALPLEELLSHAKIEDPARAETVFALAWIRQKYQPIKRTKKLAAEAAKRFEKLGNLSRRAWSSILIGDMEVKLGNLDDAGKHFQRGRELIETLIVNEPENRDREYNLGIVFERLGDLFDNAGNWKEAKEYYEKRHEIISRQVGESPEDNARQRDLSVSFDKLGNLQKQIKEYGEAEKYYRQELKIARKLAKQFPKEARVQQDLAAALRKIGDLQKEAGEYEKADRSYRQSLAISKKLTEREPENSDFQRDVWKVYNKLGDSWKAAGKLSKAEPQYRHGMEIIRKLAAQEPENNLWQQDLSESFLSFGDLALRSKEFEAAESWARKGLAGLRRLTARDEARANAYWWRALAEAHSTLGKAMAGQEGEDKEARKEFRQALKILRELERADKLTPEQDGWEAEWKAELEKL